jgi:hypothetical protein
MMNYESGFGCPPFLIPRSSFIIPCGRAIKPDALENTQAKSKRQGWVGTDLITPKPADRSMNFLFFLYETSRRRVYMDELAKTKHPGICHCQDLYLKSQTGASRTASPMTSQQMAYAQFVVTQADGQWEFRPSSVRGETIPTIFVTVGAGCLLGAVLFWITGIAFIRVAFCIPLAGVAVVSVWHTTRAWRTRTTPLTVPSNGRMSYGEKEVCAVERVRTVRVMPDPGSETDGYTIRLELADGQLVKLPGLFFGDWSDQQSARFFADELAKALKVEVSHPE